jgi:hypothetical protein
MNDTSDKALRSRKDAANPVAEKLRDHAKYGRFGEYNDVALSGAEEIERLHDLNGSLQRELSRACQETREALSREVAALRSAPETRVAPALPMRMDEPWSLPEVLAKLIEATEHSLNVHSCDNHGHELYRSAAIAGRSILHEWQNTAPHLKAGAQQS